MYKLKINTINGSDFKVFIRENDDGSVTSFGEYPGNTDYENYLSWVSEGNEPIPFDEPPAPPEPTIEEKLASVGLSIDDLKTALGIK